MPRYEFECRSCHQRFEASQSVEEHLRAPAVCPHCGATEADRIFSSFYAKTSRKA